MTFSDAVNYLERLCPPASSWYLEVIASKDYASGARKIRFQGSFYRTCLPHWDSLREKYDREYDNLDDLVRDLTAEYLAGLQRTEDAIGKVDVK